MFSLKLMQQKSSEDVFTEPFCCKNVFNSVALLKLYYKTITKLYPNLVSTLTKL